MTNQNRTKEDTALAIKYNLGDQAHDIERDGYRLTYTDHAYGRTYTDKSVLLTVDMAADVIKALEELGDRTKWVLRPEAGERLAIIDATDSPGTRIRFMSERTYGMNANKRAIITLSVSPVAPSGISQEDVHNTLRTVAFDTRVATNRSAAAIARQIRTKLMPHRAEAEARNAEQVAKLVASTNERDTLFGNLVKLYPNLKFKQVYSDEIQVSNRRDITIDPLTNYFTATIAKRTYGDDTGSWLLTVGGGDLRFGDVTKGKGKGFLELMNRQD